MLPGAEYAFGAITAIGGLVGLQAVRDRKVADDTKVKVNASQAGSGVINLEGRVLALELSDARKEAQLENIERTIKDSSEDTRSEIRKLSEAIYRSIGERK